MNTPNARSSAADRTSEPSDSAESRALGSPLKGVLDQAGIGVVVLGRDGGVRDANNAFLRLVGHDIAELRGRDEASITHPDDRAHGLATLERLAGRDGPALTSEKRYLRADGGAAPVRATVSAAHDQNGSVTGFIVIAQNLSSRRAVERARRESEARLRDFIEAAGSLWVETDARFRITLALLASTAQPSRAPDALIGRTIWEATGVREPGTDPQWRDVQTLMRGRRPFRDVRYTVTDAEGRTRYRRASGVPIFDGEGQFAGYRCVAADETAEVEARAKANATEGLLNLAIEGMSDGFAVFDAEDRLVLINRRYRDTLPPDTDWIRPGLTFEEILRTGVASGHYIEAIGNEEAFIAEHLREHREGRGTRLVRSVGNRWSRARDYRLPDGTTVIIRTDVTDLVERERELRERDERLQAITGNLPGFIFRQVVAPGGAFGTAYVSERLKEIIGVPAEEIGSGRSTLLDHVHADDRARLTRALGGRADDAKPSLIEVRLMTRPEGAVRWLRLHATAKKLPDGALQWDGIGIDVTDRKAAEDHLLQAQKTEAIGQLTGGVAHDFNNLLTVITGAAELLGERLAASEPDIAALVRDILAASGRGAELTHQLLAFARKQPLQPRAVDVNRLIHDLRPLLAGPLGEDVELRFELRADPTITHVDAHQLQSAILNLAVNAREAMPSGGRLLVETSNAALDRRQAAEAGDLRPGRYVVIRIVDTGSGMKPEVAARAIEPFFTTKPVGQGTGLGLSMAFGFAKQSGGHLALTSVPGEGTTVRLLLPQAVVVEAARDGAAVRSDRPRGTETILLVEDDPAVRGTVRTLLANLGYRVIEAASGRAALDIIAGDHPIDLLFTDVVMPGGIDGFQLVEESRRLRPGLKAMCASGYAESAIERYGRRPPGIDLLQKPFRARELARRVRLALGGEAATAG
ncbi:MAG TPA: PAS domain S-box protein [Vineibacter sp.]|nr:PAS domain S-box protein [Vineibacter sp.]